MLRPAVNRQPGFRRGLVEQSNAEKNNPIGWLAGWLALGSGWLSRTAWLVLAGWLAAGRLPSWLTGWLPGSLTRSTWLAPASRLAVARLTGLLAGRVNGCMTGCRLLLKLAREFAG